MLLTPMNLKVKLNIVVKVDNVGAFLMTSNSSTSGKTKYLDLRARYVNKTADEMFICQIWKKLGWLLDQVCDRGHLWQSCHKLHYQDGKDHHSRTSDLPVTSIVEVCIQGQLETRCHLEEILHAQDDYRKGVTRYKSREHTSTVPNLQGIYIQEIYNNTMGYITIYMHEESWYILFMYKPINQLNKRKRED